MVLTPVLSSPPAQLLEGTPLQGHCPGGEGPAGCIWPQRPQHDLGRPPVDVPPLTAPGNPSLLEAPLLLPSGSQHYLQVISK